MSVSSALMSVKEMAKGITYDDPIKTRYVFPVNVCGSRRAVILRHSHTYSLG